MHQSGVNRTNPWSYESERTIMAHLKKTFNGRPVHKVATIPGTTDVLLTFLASVRGQPRERLRITQAEMESHYKCELSEHEVYQNDLRVKKI